MSYHSVPGTFRDGYSGVYNGHEVLLDGYTSSFNVVSLPLLTKNVTQGSISCNWAATGSPSGTLQLQYSNDQGLNKNGTLNPLDDFNSWTWFNAPEPPDGSITVSNAGSALMNFGGYANTLGAYWCRLVYTRASGSIIFTAKYTLKG